MVATDVGGTCTDTVVFAAGEPIRLGKALSTPPNFADGVLDSIRSAAQTMDLSLQDMLAQTKLFVHGSTVVDNTDLTRAGSKVGLITTRGFEDTLLMTRGAYGRWGGLTEDRIKHPVKTNRPPSLVEPDCIVGVAERVDYKGAILRSSTPRRSGTRGPVPGRAAPGRGHRGFVPVVVLQSGQRTAHARGGRAHRAAALLHAVLRGRAGSRRVRTHVNDGDQRLRGRTPRAIT